MCGIAGSVNMAVSRVQLDHDLLHRGPDEQTAFQEGGLCFYHYRLAILDLSGGKQPMSYKHLTIIFNGEIYNHHEVRKKYNLQCVTSSDTETILVAYHELGDECFSEFDGMFALAIYDAQKKEVKLARDRAGKKPLYYFSKDDQFFFASELNAIRQQLQPEVNAKAIHQYVRMGYFYKSLTPYRNVHELPAGSLAVVKTEGTDRNVQVYRWWDIHRFYLQDHKVTMEEALQKTEELIHICVRRRIESSDLEVGSFLSGGIDSGLVTAIAKQYNPGLKTFTVSFQGEYDEAPLAKLVADQYKTKHHEIQIGFDSLINDVETILANYGEPFFDSSAIPSYYVSRAAKEHLTVILNGDGGDELFGGYRRYVPFARFDFFKPHIFRGPASLLNKMMPVPNNKKSKYNYIHRLMNLAGRSGLDTYLSTTIDSFEGFENNLLAGDNILDDVRTDFDQINASSLSGLKKIMNLDFDNILAGDLLVKMDIATMAHSLEGRSPLLGRELMEYVPGLPDNLKVNGSSTKVLLRKLAEKYLPPTLISQPKRGFEIPLKAWIDGQLKDLIASYILSPNAFSRNFVNPDFTRRLWDRSIAAGDEKRAKMIWTLFALDVWYQKCFLRR